MIGVFGSKLSSERVLSSKLSTAPAENYESLREVLISSSCKLTIGWFYWLHLLLVFFYSFDGLGGLLGLWRHLRAALVIGALVDCSAACDAFNGSMRVGCSVSADNVVLGHVVEELRFNITSQRMGPHRQLHPETEETI